MIVELISWYIKAQGLKCFSALVVICIRFSDTQAFSIVDSIFDLAFDQRNVSYNLAVSIEKDIIHYHLKKKLKVEVKVKVH